MNSSRVRSSNQKHSTGSFTSLPPLRGLPTPSRTDTDTTFAPGAVLTSAAATRYPIESAASILNSWITRVESSALAVVAGEGAASSNQPSAHPTFSRTNSTTRLGAVPDSALITEADVTALLTSAVPPLTPATRAPPLARPPAPAPAAAPVPAPGTAASNAACGIIELLNAEAASLTLVEPAVGALDTLSAVYLTALEELLVFMPPGTAQLLRRIFASQGSVYEAASELMRRVVERDAASALAEQSAASAEEIKAIHMQYTDGISELLVAADRTAADLRRQLAVAEAQAARFEVEVQAMQERLADNEIMQLRRAV